MATVQEQPHLADSVQSLLERLRLRIRRYVWIEGVASAVACLGAAFWILLAIDWMFEPPVLLRRAMIGLAAMAVGYVVYRLIVRRAFVPLSDSNMAVLLERRFSGFEESLLTAVDLTERDEQLAALTREMLAHTCRDAEDRAAGVDVANVLNPQPLTRSVAAAIALAVSIIIFALAFPSTFAFGMNRVTGMTDELWPRRSRLQVVGFENGEAVIARGDDIEVRVQADTAMELVPDTVQIRYRTEEGARGRENMSREGNAVAGRDPYQDFKHTFQSVPSDRTFDVIGGDYRIRDLHIRVVESPTLVETALYCEYPKYMNRGPRELPVTGTMQIPLGTRITVRAKANKELLRAQIDYPTEGDKFATQVIDPVGVDGDPRRFEFALQALNSDKTLSFTLFDTDGIHNRKPFLVSISAVPDEPPLVAVQLQGIGSAITPLARLPLVGTIKDDYGVAKTAFDFTVDAGDPREEPFAADPKAANEIVVKETFEVEPLAVKPGQKLVFGAKASDTYKLVDEDQPHVGTSERFTLDIVTPDALRAMLESRELNLRQRFETVLQEMTDTRDSIARVTLTPVDAAPPVKTTGEKAPAADAKSGDAKTGDVKTGATKKADSAKTSDKGKSTEPPKGTPAPIPADDEPPIEHPVARESLRLERALQNSEKNAGETLGVATSFDAIREELINNRIDTEEWRVRLKDYIADPLKVVSTQMFPEFDRRLQTLRTKLTEPDAVPAARQRALAQADAILVEMATIRDKMLELESFNEAVDLLRAIISSEQTIADRTRERQKQKARDLLEDDK